MERIILTVVRHLGGGFHLGVIEERRTARFLESIQVVVRAYEDLPEQRYNSCLCQYKYKSIHTPTIHSWLADKRRNNEDTIPMFIAELERTENEDVYTILRMASLKKQSRHQMYIDSSGTEHHYSKREIFRVLFQDTPLG